LADKAGLGSAADWYMSATKRSVPVEQPAGNQTTQVVSVTVAPEAKPDPKLVPMVRRAVTEALDQQNRETAAGL
jgi:hypothetical protein